MIALLGRWYDRLAQRAAVRYAVVTLVALGLTLGALYLWYRTNVLSPACGFDCPPASGSVSNAPGP